MRFPLTLTTTMAGYLARKKLTGQRRFPLVLMLEPLHACNLTCPGCGRIREYDTTIKQRLSVAECLASVDECGAPIVSICGGEPLIYPEAAVCDIDEQAEHVSTSPGHTGPVGLNCAGFGSSVCVTASFGFAAAAHVLRALAKQAVV